MPKYLRATAAAIIAAAFVLGAGQAALAAPQDLVVKAQRVLEDMKTDPNFEAFRQSVKTAKGILVIPTLLKAGFFFGVEGGSGVLLARNEKGEWSHPAFFTLGGASFGLQIGVQAAEVAFVLRTEKGLEAIISSEVKLGLDGSISIGTFGKGIEGSTTLGLGGDIVAYSKSVGAFAGVALEGAIIRRRNDLNREYYGDAAATSRAIVLEGGHANPQADELRETLAGF
jgi:lipid-binding SYLF domain-containing protein